MTDLEMTKLCAEAMGYPTDDPEGAYNPLHYDALAMDLVKRFGLVVGPYHDLQRPEPRWLCSYRGERMVECLNEDLNRAIVSCVARMQAARSS